jgi:predicted dehydrogenase
MRLEPDPPIRCRDYRIGAIGAGFIMAEVQLAAYRLANFPVIAITSRTVDKARAVAARWNIPRVHETPLALIEDPDVEILDIAYPPHLQPGLIRAALAQPHIKGVLVQKPMAMDHTEAQRLVAEAAAAGKALSVNQNMRFDQSMRALKQLLERHVLGAPVFASIEMRAIPHWQPFLQEYDRLTLLNMSIHHLDVLRFLFGEVRQITTSVRDDPRTSFPHFDGICCSTLLFHSGVMALSLEDVWAGPHDETIKGEHYIKWRVEGTDGLAQGTIGWPDYPHGSPSTLAYSARESGGEWIRPHWDTRWFPHAFIGVMEQLQYAIKSGLPPELDAADNLRTMMLVDAAYASAREKRTVALVEVES